MGVGTDADRLHSARRLSLSPLASTDEERPEVNRSCVGANATARRARVMLRSVALAAGVVAIVGVAAGCSASGTPAGAAPDGGDTAVTAPATAAVATVTDKESCAAFGDVLTVLHNAMTGLREERMTQQEYDGWLHLATRVLDRVPVSGEGTVSDAITELKESAPPVPQGAMASTTIATPEWYDLEDLADACAAAGAELAAEGFTGG